MLQVNSIAGIQIDGRTLVKIMLLLMSAGACHHDASVSPGNLSKHIANSPACLHNIELIPIQAQICLHA